MRYAVVDGQAVVNVILAEPGFELDGFTLIELGTRENVAPGWAYRDDQFIGPSGQGAAPAQPSDPPPDPVDVLAQLAALQDWAAAIQLQVDAATEILMGGVQ